MYISGLRQYATKKSLSDIEIVKEFECIEMDIDEDKSEYCVCGKEELKYLYYMKNITTVS